jgi:hypothetical protein
LRLVVSYRHPSYAAVALARALFRKGADFTAAMAPKPATRTMVWNPAGTRPD